MNDPTTPASATDIELYKKLEPQLGRDEHVRRTYNWKRTKWAFAHFTDETVLGCYDTLEQLIEARK